MATINKERRKRVMQRSARLGHCVCDPAKSCPCDLFKEQNICLCAGERLESPTGPVRLTKLVAKPGCASKVDQAFLKRVLAQLPANDDPRVLVGVAAGDDAGVYDIGDGMALVQTVDVFTPSVDDPYTFGQIAAANSVSDIYAMGGQPLTALSVLGFPVNKIPDEAMSDILRGGIDKMAEAGVAVIGGHSINDTELKAGFAVTGIIESKKVKTNNAAQPGDILILTKPIGTGIVAFASQIDLARKESIDAATQSMISLNKTAAKLMTASRAHACTDVTGFSLLGHLVEMATRSSVDAEITWDNIPLFPGVLDYVAQGVLPGAIERNKESCGHNVIADTNVHTDMADICYDAQTSGGLLIAVAPDTANQLLQQLHEQGIPKAAVIGTITQKGTGQVTIKTNGTRTLAPPQPARPTHTATTATQPTQAPCCADSQPTDETTPCCSATPPIAQTTCCTAQSDPSNAPSPSQTTAERFKAFLAGANSPHELDAPTKQIINIALSVLSRCKPCLETHLRKAPGMGLTPQEIDEAAWMAIAFGGSPVMMFYNEVKNSMTP